mgnify:FL=1
MPFCHENKFIFYHIPRCAGTSVEQYFNLCNISHGYGVVHNDDQIITLHHLTPHDMLTAGLVDDDVFHSYFKFTIIRDPFDRLVSDYLWQKTHDRHGEFHDLSFLTYLDKAEQIIREGRYFEKVHYDHFRPMIEYCFRDGQLMVDDILLLHNIDQGLERVKDRIGSVKLHRINASPDDIPFLDNLENRKRVYDIYAHDKLFFDRILEVDQAPDTESARVDRPALRRKHCL